MICGDRLRCVDVQGNLNSSSVVPLYQQLREIMREKIETGEWERGQLIPGENELCRMFDLSRGTVRQALAELVQDGLLERRQGKGTFVSGRKITDSLVEFASFTQRMLRMGFKPRSTLLSVERVLASAGVPRWLQIPKDSPVVRIERLRVVDENPVMFERCFLPGHLFEGLEKHDLGNIPLYDILRNEYGVVPVRSEEYFEPTLIKDYESLVLGVQKGSPALFLETVAYTEDDTPILLSRGIVRGDKCRFYFELK